MSASDPRPGSSRRRGKGRPPIIDREKILIAARAIPAERLTMQAVATELGVDPTALNYHVGGRAGLMRLTALDRLTTAIDDGAVDRAAGDWKDVLRAVGLTVRQAIASVGVLSEYIEMDVNGLVPFFALADRAIGALLDAGFDDETAGRAVGLVMYIAGLAGKAAIVNCADSSKEKKDVFSELGARIGADMPHIARIIEWNAQERGADHHAAETVRQFEFSMEVLLAGLEARLGS